MLRAFWFALALATALVTHSVYVLTAPSRNFTQKAAALLADSQLHAMEILTPGEIAALFPAYGVGDVVALCRYDLDQGEVEITARLPRGYWTLSVFTARGQQEYALNDAQAENFEFKVEIRRAPDFLAQIQGVLSDGATEDNEITDAGWRVATPDRMGLAVLWMPVADPLFRSRILAAMVESQCRLKPKG
jgi:uncharacterized membrane protein